MSDDPSTADTPPPHPGTSRNSPSDPAATPFYERDNFWLMVLHLSPLTGYATFVGFFVGPIIVWAIFRDKYPAMETAFRQSLNFQISVLIYAVAAFFVTLVTLGIGGLLTVPALLVLSLFHIAVPVIAGVKAMMNESFSYPLTIDFLKAPVSTNQ